MSRNPYMRTLPYLGFDPAPGDAAGMHQLARQYTQAAEKIHGVRVQVAGVDLSGWVGRTGEAVGMHRGAIVSVLDGQATYAGQVAQACTTWAGQLQGFQAQAAALEQQARAINEQHDAFRATALNRLTSAQAILGEFDSAKAQLRAVLQQAEQLHQQYLSAAAKLAAQLDSPGVMDRIEPIRKWLETGLAAGDLSLLDHWLGKFTETGEKAAENREELLKPFDEAFSAAEKLAEEGKLGSGELSRALEDAGRQGDIALSRLDAWEAFVTRWAKVWSRWFPVTRGGSYTLAGLGIIADIMTIISPLDSGEMGTVDRVMGGINAVGLGTMTAVDAGGVSGLIAADSVALAIPVAGEVLAAVTGAYLAGDFIYHGRRQLADASRDIGHAVVRADEDLAQWETEGVIKAEDPAVGVAKSAVHAGANVAHHLWHSVTSEIGSWF